MKSAHIFLSLFFIACLAQFSFGQGITGTDHDFSGRSWNSSGEICIVCHTPHNANGNVVGAPLWNHQVTGATFTPYSSTTLDATVGQPAGNSKLCLSCHDGTVAVENYGNVTNGAELISGSELIGTDLSNDHPISFSYDATLATNDGGLFDPTTQTSGLGGTINDDMLFAGQLECASCHDVHNGAGIGNFLRKSNASSALCLTCHNK
ncbi:Cytochrome c family protein [hydrothermal vent metagenome]|uniref:Cytochrome c family protein n=1 Tax=hydrothermal vent metagenome TaxID=652676 RepID=A0A3B0TWB2_9ZZZZ